MKSKFYVTLFLCFLITTAQYAFTPKQDADKIEKLYKLLEVKVNAEKFYSYKNGVELKGDSIIGVKDAEVQAYLTYIKSVDLFSDEYLEKEKKWFASVKKEIAKKGFSLEKQEDKYYGENPEEVKKELSLRQNEMNYYFARYFGMSQFYGHRYFTSAFKVAGYSLKVKTSLVEGSWYIDAIKQVE
jgi:hypothetical protein